jgi:membrane protein YdbS with pleckstrin-like domain
MKFIRKKNLQKTEELLHRPKLHWMFIVRHMVMSLPFLLVLLALWAVILNYADSFYWPGDMGIGGYTLPVTASIAATVIKYVFLTVVCLVLLAVAWRIFLYLGTEFGVTNKRLLLKKGIIRIAVAEIPFDRIESLFCRQGLLGRIFNYGTVCVTGVGGTKTEFYMVSRPLSFRLKVADVMEKNKTVTVVHGLLPEIRPVPPEKTAQKEEPIYRYGTFVRVLPEAPGGVPQRKAVI